MAKTEEQEFAVRTAEGATFYIKGHYISFDRESRLIKVLGEGQKIRGIYSAENIVGVFEHNQ